MEKINENTQKLNQKTEQIEENINNLNKLTENNIKSIEVIFY